MRHGRRGVEGHEVMHKRWKSSLPLPLTTLFSNDMQDKSEYAEMVNVTYVISCSAYAVMACVGYLMFGNSAQSEVENTFLSIENTF